MAVLATAVPAVLAADVLLQALVLVGLGLVADVGVGVGRRGLRRRARAGGDVPTGDRDGRVAVDGVLVALGDAECPLVRLSGLHAGLEAARSAGTGGEVVMAVTALVATTVLAADVLLQALVLVGIGLVADVGGGIGRRRLRRRARAGGDVPTGDRDRRVGVHGVLVALGDAERPLVRLGVRDTRLEAAGPAATGQARAPADVLAQVL